MTGRWVVDEDGRLVYPLHDLPDVAGRAIYIGPGTFGVLWRGVHEAESRGAHAALADALNGEEPEPTAEQVAEHLTLSDPRISLHQIEAVLVAYSEWRADR